MKTYGDCLKWHDNFVRRTFQVPSRIVSEVRGVNRKAHKLSR